MHNIEKFDETVFNLFPSNKAIFILSNVIVDIDTGLIFDPERNQIVWECANEALIFNDREPFIDHPGLACNDTRDKIIANRKENAKNYFLDKLQTAQLIDHECDFPVLHLLSSTSEYNYGHIFDVLQKIYTFDQITLNHFSVLLSSIRKLHNIDDHLSALFSEYKPKYYYYNRDNLVKVKTLIFIRPPARPLYFIPEAFDFLRKKYLNYFNISDVSAPNLNVFLLREQHLARSIENMAQLKNFLLSNNITVVTGSEPLKEQIEICVNAKRVAGTHGSSFINTHIFCSEHTHFLELIPRSFLDKYGDDWSILKYQYKLSKNSYLQDSCADTGIHTDTVVDLNRLLHFYTGSTE